MATELADFFSNVNFDGILGLAWPALATDGAIPFMFNAKELLDSPVFSIYMTSSAGLNDYGGEIMVGGIDSSKYTGDIAYINLASEPLYWQFWMDGIIVGNYALQQQSFAISDTGTSFISGPANVVREIMTALNACFDEENALYRVDCNQCLPNITFVIDGKQFPVEPKNYILQAWTNANEIGCFVTIEEMPLRSSVDWILGDPFIRQYYSIYDMGNSRLGLANAVSNEKRPNPPCRRINSSTNCRFTNDFDASASSKYVFHSVYIILLLLCTFFFGYS